MTNTLWIPWIYKNIINQKKNLYKKLRSNWTAAVKWMGRNLWKTLGKDLEVTYGITWKVIGRNCEVNNKDFLKRNWDVSRKKLGVQFLCYSYTFSYSFFHKFQIFYINSDALTPFFILQAFHMFFIPFFKSIHSSHNTRLSSPLKKYI